LQKRTWNQKSEGILIIINMNVSSKTTVYDSTVNQFNSVSMTYHTIPYSFSYVADIRNLQQTVQTGHDSRRLSPTQFTPSDATTRDSSEWCELVLKLCWARIERSACSSLCFDATFVTALYAVCAVVYLEMSLCQYQSSDWL